MGDVLAALPRGSEPLQPSFCHIIWQYGWPLKLHACYFLNILYLGPIPRVPPRRQEKANLRQARPRRGAAMTVHGHAG